MMRTWLRSLCVAALPGAVSVALAAPIIVRDDIGSTVKLAAPALA